MRKFNWKKLGISNTDQQWIRLKARWLNLIRRKGGRCECCGEYDPSCLEFHHVDPSIKDNQISYLIMGYCGKKESSKSGWERAQEEIENCMLLCRNCHYDIHYSNKEGSAFKRRLLSLIGCDRCVDCGYSSNKSVLEFHHEGGKDFTIGRSGNSAKSDLELKSELGNCVVVCKCCHKKRHKDLDRWNRLGPYIEEMADCYEPSFGIWDHLIKDEYWLSEFDSLYRSGLSYVDMAKSLLSGVSSVLGTKSAMIGTIASERIELGILSDRGYKRLDGLSDSELVRDSEVAKFLKFRDLGYSRKRACDELRITRGQYDVLLRYLLDRGVCEYHEEPKVYLDIDSDIIRMSGLGMSAEAIARELGCGAVTVRKKRNRLISEGKMEKPDYGAYSRGRESWNKGKGRELSEDTLTEEEWQMIVMREDGKTAEEVGEAVGRTAAAVRIVYSKMIKAGIIESSVRRAIRRNK